MRTGYSAIADEWVAIRPGTDGLFVLALVHELLKAGKIDLDYLARYTNAPWLVIQNPGAADDGLSARDESGHPPAWDKDRGEVVDALAAGLAAAAIVVYRMQTPVMDRITSYNVCYTKLLRTMRSTIASWRARGP